MATGLGKATSALKGFQNTAQSINPARINQAFSGAGANQFVASMGQATSSIARFVPGLDLAISAFHAFRGMFQSLGSLSGPKSSGVQLAIKGRLGLPVR